MNKMLLASWCLVKLTSCCVSWLHLRVMMNTTVVSLATWLDDWLLYGPTNGIAYDASEGLHNDM
jgi:hypothetical protein